MPSCFSSYFGQSLRLPFKTITMITHPLKSGVKEHNELFELSFTTNLEYFAPTPTPSHNLAVLQASSWSLARRQAHLRSVLKRKFSANEMRKILASVDLPRADSTRSSRTERNEITSSLWHRKKTESGTDIWFVLMAKYPHSTLISIMFQMSSALRQQTNFVTKGEKYIEFNNRPDDCSWIRCRQALTQTAPLATSPDCFPWPPNGWNTSRHVPRSKKIRYSGDPGSKI